MTGMVPFRLKDRANFVIEMMHATCAFLNASLGDLESAHAHGSCVAGSSPSFSIVLQISHFMAFALLGKNP